MNANETASAFDGFTDGGITHHSEKMTLACLTNASVLFLLKYAIIRQLIKLKS